MTRIERFTFLCNLEERKAIAVLANHLQRSQSDAIRYVVVEAVEELSRRGILTAKQNPNTKVLNKLDQEPNK